MEVGRVGRKTIQTDEKKTVSSRKDFSQSFSREKEKKSEQELKMMADKIKKRGNRLVLTKTYADVKIYKKMIKEYLESVLQYMYDTKRDISFWQTQYFITVDQKLEELTKVF